MTNLAMFLIWVGKSSIDKRCIIFQFGSIIPVINNPRTVMIQCLSDTKKIQLAIKNHEAMAAKPKCLLLMSVNILNANQLISTLSVCVPCNWKRRMATNQVQFWPVPLQLYLYTLIQEGLLLKNKVRMKWYLKSQNKTTELRDEHE